MSVKTKVKTEYLLTKKIAGMLFHIRTYESLNVATEDRKYQERASINDVKYFIIKRTNTIEEEIVR